MKKYLIVCNTKKRAGELFDEYLRLVRHIPAVKANKRKLIVYIEDQMIYRFVGGPEAFTAQTGVHEDNVIYGNEFEEILDGIRRKLNDYRSDEGSDH